MLHEVDVQETPGLWSFPSNIDSLTYASAAETTYKQSYSVFLMLLRPTA